MKKLSNIKELIKTLEEKKELTEIERDLLDNLKNKKLKGQINKSHDDNT